MLSGRKERKVAKNRRAGPVKRNAVSSRDPAVYVQPYVGHIHLDGIERCSAVRFKRPRESAGPVTNRRPKTISRSRPRQP